MESGTFLLEKLFVHWIKARRSTRRREGVWDSGGDVLEGWGLGAGLGVGLAADP